MFTRNAVWLLVLQATSLLSHAQQAEEWTCPPVDKVALLARAPGWVSGDTLTYSYGAPKYQFDMMRNSTTGPAAGCFYRVEGGGRLQIWKVAKCESGKGTWKAAGSNSECESANTADCSLRCVPQ